MIYYKSARDIELIRESARVVSRTLGLMAENIRPGITTLELDALADEFIHDNGGTPSFKGYNGFPNALCTSVNEQVVHGIPNDKPLEEGDIVSVDCGVYKNGFHGDHAYTFAVGEVSEDVLKLMRVTKECLDMGVQQARVGKRIGDIGAVVQNHAHKNKYGVVRELVGHGLGQNLHEEPNVPNYGRRGRGVKIQNGLVIAIEPMINMGIKRIKMLSDKWTVVTADGQPSAHYEHDVAVVNGQPVVLSTFDYVEEALRKRNMILV